MKIDEIVLSLNVAIADHAVPDGQMIAGRVDYDIFARSALIRLRRYVWEQEVERVVHVTPANWWEHLKNDLFPSWLRKRFPVKVKTIRTAVMATYPSLLHPPGHDPVMKIRVLSSGESWSEGCL